jgi:hypothetical protein
LKKKGGKNYMPLESRKHARLNMTKGVNPRDSKAIKGTMVEMSA